ncbi:hypothetical protein YC2023_000690 [Brassica napus]
MATNACKFLCLILLFAFVAQEWEVILTNLCSCTGTDVVLSCVGFKSLTPIDRSQISVSDNECSLINNLYGETDFVFKYVWTKEFNIKIKSREVAWS